MPVDRFLHPRAGHSAKVTSLSDFEYRVWTQYILSADDFGVMRASATKLQSDNKRLETAPRKQVQAALERCIGLGLVRAFEHQGERFVFQHDWQTWQGVEYPRATIEPRPPDLEACDDATRALFDKHPGGAGKRRGQPPNGSGGGGGTFAERSPNVPRMVPEGSPSNARACPRETANANGKRLSANGQRLTAPADGVAPPLDVWLRQLQATYPRQAVTSGYLTESAFFDAIALDGRLPAEVFAEMVANLENQMRGYQWRVKRMIPRLVNWLRDGLWHQLHDEQPPTDLVSERTLGTLAAADAFVKGGTHGTH